MILLARALGAPWGGATEGAIEDTPRYLACPRCCCSFRVGGLCFSQRYAISKRIILKSLTSMGMFVDYTLRQRCNAFNHTAVTLSDGGNTKGLGSFALRDDDSDE